jgi:hypothetical protein
MAGLDIHAGLRRLADDGNLFTFQFVPGQFADPMSEMLGGAVGDDEIPGYEHLGALLTRAHQILAALTHDEVMELQRRREQGGPLDPFDFTGSPETQYHHRAYEPGLNQRVRSREDAVEGYYDEMRQRNDQGLPRIDFNAWFDSQQVPA